ncbi:60Kd inner membrane protein-domain-containing protein [Parasitella parasitica]|nr:60Kd inner membrane protein-domain-containing protein [Parasitella parasitica]
MTRPIIRIKRSLPFYTQKSVSYRLKLTRPLSLSLVNDKREHALWSTAPITSMTIINDTTTDTALPAVLAANESILYSIHNTGMPWWATIAASTLLLRTTMTLPIAIYQQRSIGTMINLAPMVQSWAETLKVQLAKENRQHGWPYQKYQQELQKQYRRKVKSIYAHHGCARWKLLLLPWIQIPLFVSMSLTLRHLTAYPLPWLGQTSDLPASGLSDGGLAWFVDLTAVDPTMAVPIMIGAGNLINVEVSLLTSVHLFTIDLHTYTST